MITNFISNKKLIEPRVSNDWSFTVETDKNQIFLYSKRLDQCIRYIPSTNLLSFIFENNFSIDGNLIKGDLAVIQGKRIVNNEKFKELRDKEVKYDFIINYSDLILGKTYVDKKGKKFVYMGYKYVSYIKPNTEYEITNIYKKHFGFFYSKFRDNREIPFSIEILNKDVLSLDTSFQDMPIDRINNSFERFLSHRLNYTYFSDEKIKNPIYGLIPLNNTSQKCLFVETNIGIIGVKKTNKYTSIPNRRSHSYNLELLAKYDNNIKKIEDLSNIPEIINKETSLEYIAGYRIGIVNGN